MLYPALHSLISRWAPPDERGKFISALLGGTFGTVVTWPMAGILTEYFGWCYAFYVPAIVTGIVTIIWFFLVHDTPAEHPRIDPTEQEYIEKSLGNTISKKKVNTEDKLFNFLFQQTTENNAITSFWLSIPI